MGQQRIRVRGDVLLDQQTGIVRVAPVFPPGVDVHQRRRPHVDPTSERPALDRDVGQVVRVDRSRGLHFDEAMAAGLGWRKHVGTGEHAVPQHRRLEQRHGLCAGNVYPRFL